LLTSGDASNWNAPPRRGSLCSSAVPACGAIMRGARELDGELSGVIFMRFVKEDGDDDAEDDEEEQEEVAAS
jgi:hypothetical protein